MKKVTLTSLTLLLTVHVLFAQQTIVYTQDFSSGAGGWSLGTANNFDTWMVNSNYSCSSTTPNQGGGNYLHITDDLSGDYCAHSGFYGLGSSGQCYATMNSGVSTLGLNSLFIQFDWLCVGQTGPVLASYGTVEYSIDGGSNWTQLTSPVSQFSGQNNWTQTTISNVPAMHNQPDLRLRFGFTNSGYGTNPAFAIDNILITDALPTGMPELEKDIVFIAQPGNSGFSLQTSASLTSVPLVYDALGKLVHTEISGLASQQVSVTCTATPAGLYLIQVPLKGSYKTFKWLVNP